MALLLHLVVLAVGFSSVDNYTTLAFLNWLGRFRKPDPYGIA